jgi:hypothetical protein
MISWVVADSGILLATMFVELHSLRAIALWEYWNDKRFQVPAPTLF